MSDSRDIFLKLLDEPEFKKILAKIKPPIYKPSFFEVAGKENSETVMVNTLTFFMENEHHNFSNSVYEKFCETMRNNFLDENEKETFEISYGELMNIRKEVSCKENEKSKKRGRLDIILETENALIGIEAKVNHNLKNNPWKTYGEYLENESNRLGKTPRQVVLCKRGTKDIPDGWIEVNWEDILTNTANEEDPYAPLWEGIVKTFRSESMIDDNDLEKIAERQNDYLAIYKMISDTWKKKNDDAEKLRREIIKKKPELKENVRTWGKFGSEKTAFPYVVIETEIDEIRYVIDIIVSAKGYGFIAFAREGGEPNRIHPKLKYKDKEIPFTEWMNYFDGASTKRAFVKDLPDELKGTLVNNGHFFNGGVDEIAAVAIKLHELITDSNH